MALTAVSMALRRGVMVYAWPAVAPGPGSVITAAASQETTIARGRRFGHKCGCKSTVIRKMSTEATPGTLIPVSEVTRFVRECMEAVGTPTAHGQALADVLTAADYRGHFSHGLNRLEMYVNDVKKKVCDSAATPTILKESAATAHVEGNNTLGPVVGNFCMELAMKKAKEAGVGWVSAKGSNHYGIAGWYSMQASQKGLLGMSFTNTSPLMAPTRAKKATLGTNPITLAAPALPGDDFVLDMATTAVAVGKIEVQRRKNEPIPEGWAVDKDGKVTPDGKVAMETGALMPLGGSELHSGYKGYGLSALVEIFCGILSGGSYGPNVRKWMNTTIPANLGQCFIALDPECFAPGFQDRMADLMNHLRNLEPAEADKPVLCHGDPERGHIKKVDTEGGIRYHINQVTSCLKLAEDLGVKPMKTIG